MLTANQFHKQSGIRMEFQDFLGRMKETFGENFMEKVNEGKVKLQEVQKALGLKVTKKEGVKDENSSKAQTAKIQARRKIVPKKVSVTGKSGMKCSSCQDAKNASGDKKQSNAVRNVAIVVGLGAVVYWAMKNRR